MTITNRVLEVMKTWDMERLQAELEMFIRDEPDNKLAKLFFDDIATEEEHEKGELS